MCESAGSGVRVSGQRCASRQQRCASQLVEMSESESAGSDVRDSKQWCACQQAVVCESAGRDVQVSAGMINSYP